jgi:Ser/Thr protein kinase RdoA (MazF antagonist)
MDDLIALYQQRLNLQKAHFLLIDHEEAMVATVFKVTQPDGKQLILKICSRTGDYLREVCFLSHFAGKVPVPRIIQHVLPEADLHAAILMECLPGALLKVTDLNDKLAYEIGSSLARIHLERVKGYGDLTEPDHLNSDPRIHFTLKFEEGLQECGNHLPKNLLEKCRQYYDRHLDLLISADGPCIIHRDFRPGNLIVDNGELQGIIDWSSGRGGFAEEDFCPLEFGEWSTTSYKNSFLEGYTSIRKIPHYHDMMPLLRLSRAIATIGFTVKRGSWESRNARIYQFNRQFLESFLNNMSD